MTTDRAMRSTRWTDALAVACVTLVVYGSLMPFNFSLIRAAEPHARLLGLPFIDVGLPDIMSNIALYLPLGVALCAALIRRGRGFLRAGAVCLLAAAALSYAMEWAQTFSATRMASAADVVCNLIGTAIGVLVYAPGSRLWHRLAPEVVRDLGRAPTGVAAAGWACLVAVTSLAPFDVTLDVSHVAKAVRAAHFVPFVKHHELAQRVRDEATGAVLATALDPQRLWELRLSYIADACVFFVLAFLLVHHGRRLGRSAWASFGKSCEASLTLAAVLTGFSVLVLSVGLDTTRFLTRGLGALSGAALYPWVIDWTVGGPAAAPAERGRRLRRATHVGLALTIVYVLAWQLAPFRFHAAAFATVVDRIEWVPLGAYLPAKLPGAVLDTMRQSFRFLAIGGLLASCSLVAGVPFGPGRCFKVGIVTGACVAALELVQCWLPGRIPAVTDVLVAGCASAGGMVLANTLFKVFGANRPAPPAERIEPVILNVEIPPPSPDAPVERPLSNASPPSCRRVSRVAESAASPVERKHRTAKAESAHSQRSRNRKRRRKKRKSRR